MKDLILENPIQTIVDFQEIDCVFCVSFVAKNGTYLYQCDERLLANGEPI